MLLNIFSVNELLKVKEDLTKERDEQLSEIVKLREQLAQSASRQQDLEAGIADTTSKIQEVSHPFSSRKCTNKGSFWQMLLLF